jgi:hypothetical protein
MSSEQPSGYKRVLEEELERAERLKS